LQGGSVAGAGEEADVYLEVVAQVKETLFWPLARSLSMSGSEATCSTAAATTLARRRAGDEEVEVAYGLAAAAEGAGGVMVSMPGKARMRSEMRSACSRPGRCGSGWSSCGSLRCP